MSLVFTFSKVSDRARSDRDPSGWEREEDGMKHREKSLWLMNKHRDCLHLPLRSGETERDGTESEPRALSRRCSVHTGEGGTQSLGLEFWMVLVYCLIFLFQCNILYFSLVCIWDTSICLLFADGELNELRADVCGFNIDKNIACVRVFIPLGFQEKATIYWANLFLLWQHAPIVEWQN